MVSAGSLHDSTVNSHCAFNFAVVFAMVIMVLVKAAAHTCGCALPWFGRGLVKRGTSTGSTSERASQSSTFGLDTMPRLRAPPPAYIHPPSYLDPVPMDGMYQKEVGGEHEGDAPTLEAHVPLSQISLPHIPLPVA